MDICGGERYFKRNTVEVGVHYFATLFILGCFTLLSTYLLLYLFITDAMFLNLYKNSVSTIFYDSESLAYSFKFLIIFLFSTIINFEWALRINKFFSIKFYILGSKVKNYLEGGNLKKIIVWFNFLYHKLYYDYILNLKIGNFFMRIFKFCYKVLDKGIFDILGPEGFTVAA